MEIAAKGVARHVDRSIHRKTGGWIYSVQRTRTKQTRLVGLAVSELDLPGGNASYHYSKC
jgi:hypothetical protein